MRLFNALNGAEVKAIILREIDQAMEADEQFSKHLTYPLVEWEWQLKVKAHQESGEFQASADGAVAVKQTEPMAVVLKGGRSVMKSEALPESQAPDEVRAEADLPVLTATTTQVGMVEAPTDAFAELLAKKARRPGEARREPAEAK